VALAFTATLPSAGIQMGTGAGAEARWAKGGATFNGGTAYLLGVGGGARRNFTTVTEANMQMSKCWHAAAGALTALALALVGCGERSGLEPAPVLPTALLRTYTFSGRVVNDAGDPVRAQVKYLFEPTSISIELSQVVAYTDPAGRYTITFTARCCGLEGYRVDTTGAFAMAQVTSEGYEYDARYFFADAAVDPASFRLHPVQTIMAGDSAAVKLRATDPVCSFNIPTVLGGCRIVRIVIPANGALTVSVANVGGGGRPFFAIDCGDGCLIPSGNGELSVAVFAGDIIAINLVSPLSGSDEGVVLRSTFTRH
jgi:hypothetical protein